MKTFSERLNEALVMRKITPADLSRATGIGEGAISQYRKGTCKAAQTNLEKISRALRVPIPWLMGASDDLSSIQPSNILPIPTTHKIPLVGSIACGKPILAVEEGGEEVDTPDWVKADFALRCKGDSMINARIFDGDIVYIKSQPEVENGQIAAVAIADEATLKRVFYTPGADTITLRACNPLYPDMVYTGPELDQIHIIGKAVAFTSTLVENQR